MPEGIMDAMMTGQVALHGCGPETVGVAISRAGSMYVVKAQDGRPRRWPSQSRYSGRL